MCGVFSHKYWLMMKSTACVQMTDSKEEASLWPNYPNKAAVSQARVLIGSQFTWAEQDRQKSKGTYDLKMNVSKITAKHPQ